MLFVYLWDYLKHQHQKGVTMDKQQLSNVCYTASLASVIVSIATWVFISPEDPAHGERFALFIGLWAPTLMGLANYYKELE